MDMIDILGGMLGHKTTQGGKGSDVLKDMFGRGGRSAPEKERRGPIDIGREAQELEEMLNVANDHSSSRSGSFSQTHSRPSPAPRSPAPRSPAPQSPAPRSSVTHRSSPTHEADPNERALILVRAMANAAKADGRVDRDEQQSILSHIKDPSPDVIQFLQDEFRKPLDVQGFANSVPTGMEQQVYMLSLIAMDLDTGVEAKYLMELSDALRLSPEVRQQIHDRVGAPNIF